MTQIFRITHFKNLPFILQNGLHCPHSEVQDGGFVPIGYPTLVKFRNDTIVPVEPGGTLSDYIPFYFWYQSPMLYVIYQGNDPEVIKIPQEEIIYLVSSLEVLKEKGCNFVFTDRHAKLAYAKFYTDTADLDKVNWDVIKSSQWGRQYGSEKREIKQAECLVHKHLPIEALIGIAVINEKMEAVINQMLSANNAGIPVKVKQEFYF